MHQRGTLEPQIPNAQRLVGNDLGFQEADIKATQGRALFDHANKKLHFGFQNEQEEQAEYDEDQIGQNNQSFGQI